MTESKKNSIDLKQCMRIVLNFFQGLWQSIVGILKLNKDYVIWIICYFITLYPLKLITDWYFRFNPNTLDLKVWFAVLVVYFIITVLFIQPILRDK